MFSIFSNKRIVGNQAENQHSENQRDSVNNIRAHMIGNQYIPKDVSYDYSLCYQYFYNSTPLNTAINKISQDCAKISIKTNDKRIKDNDYIYSIVSNLTKNAIKNLLLTGNAFIRVILSSANSNNISSIRVIDSRVIGFDSNFVGKADSFMVGNIKYSYKPMNGYFMAEDEKSYIYVIKNEDNFTNFGIPPLINLISKIDYMLEYEKRQATVVASGVDSKLLLFTDSHLDSDDKDGIISSINKSSSISIINNTRLDKTLDISSKIGADSLAIYNKYEKSIYDNYHIPAPLIASEVQTYSNFEESIEQYVEECIIPNIQLVLNAINLLYSDLYAGFLGFYYALSREAVTLQKQRLERMKLAKETQVLTINEIRESGGYENIGAAGDVLANDDGII